MRYLVFAGSNYYPSGGMDDLYRNCDTLEDARLSVDRMNTDVYDWYQVYDADEQVVVERGGC